MKVTIDINEQILEDILITAIESGIGYWANKVRPGNLSVINGEGIPYYAHVTHEHWEIKIYDKYEKNSPYTLTKKKLQSGLAIMAECYPRHFANLDTGNFDSTTADVFIQCCLFGELVYG
tara:strand:- start:74 stop:433 length:360 start_codon:yes stop_codon:yes gene_type:complete